jgi:hypothetical protein
MIVKVNDRGPGNFTHMNHVIGTTAAAVQVTIRSSISR